MDDLSRFFAGSVSAPQNGFSMPIGSASSLILVRQTSHSEESVNRNGIQKKMSIVVKNSPFIVEMALSATVAPGSVDLSKVSFDGFLAYDSDTPGTLVGKDVDFIKVKPMEFKVLSSNAQSQHVECEARIKVLTSQHEGALFRLRIQGYNPITRQEIAGLTLYSNPIKVISKPEPSSKKKQLQAPSANPVSHTTNSSNSSNSSSSNSSSISANGSGSSNITGNKRKSPSSVPMPPSSMPSVTLSGFQTQHPVQQGDLLLELIQRIEKQQEEQQRILFQLLKQQPNESGNNNNNSSSTTTTTTTSSTSSEEPSAKKQKIDDSNSSSTTTTTTSSSNQPQQPLPTTSGLDDMFLLVTKEPFNFEEAFQHLIRSYILLTPEEKPEMIRRLIRGMSVRDTERVQEMLDLFWSEGLQRELGGETLGFGGNQQSQCTCKDCPYRAPSEDLYRDLFTGTPSNTLQSPASSAPQQNF